METQIKDFVLTFLSILYEAMPFIVLGALIAGVLEVMVPQRWIARIIPSNPIVAIAIGGLLGLIFPMCECGIIPVMRRLLRKGVPLGACVCYLLAGPIINVVVMLSTEVAFSGSETNPIAGTGGAVRHFSGPEMMGLRCLLGYLVAFGTAVVVDRQYRKYGETLLAMPRSGGHHEHDHTGSFLQKMGTITETALHDIVDITAFLILGALLSAFTRIMVSNEQIASWSAGYPLLANAIMMGLAIVLCLCSEADAFVAASFTSTWPSAKLAFLVLGPMMDLKLFMMYFRIFKPRLIATIICLLIVQVFVYTGLLYLWIARYGADVLGPPR